MSTLLARSVHGLEWVLAAEVAALPGVADLALDRRQPQRLMLGVDGVVAVVEVADLHG